MAVKTEGPIESDLLKYELNPVYSREVVTLLTGTAYQRGAVLGRITASGKYKLATATGADGAETAAAVLLHDADATGGDVSAVVLARGPVVVSRDALVHDASVDDAAKVAAKTADLVAAGIVVRDTA